MIPKVLIIEDNTVTLDELEFRIKYLGYDVETAVSFQEADEHIAKNIPDLIISDINLGEENDGIDYVNTLNEKYSTIPVIYLTAYSDENTIDKAQASEPYSYLIKPVKERELKIAIHVALNKSRNEKKLIEANATKDKLISLIAHDIASPIDSIMGIGKRIIDSQHAFNNEELERIITLIYNSAKRSNVLMKSLMEWSQNQLEGINIDKQNIKLKDLIKEIIFTLEEKIAQKKLNVINNVDDDIEVFIDKNIYNIVIRNALTNAIKFTYMNGDIKFHSIKNNTNNTLELHITDSGIGMNETQLNDLFKINNRSRQYGTKNEEGNGIGLVLCKELLEKHKADIMVTSKKGEGTDIKLPMNLA